MARAVVTLALAGLIFGCRPPVRQYDLLRQPISCDEANDLVFRSMKAMGFQITGLELARPGKPGRVEGVRELRGTDTRTQHAVVSIRCTDEGVDLIAAEPGHLGQSEIKRGFLITYKSLVGMAQREAEARARAGAGETASQEPEGGLQVLLEPLYGFASKLEFGLNLEAAGVLPVRVTIRNPTRRAYRLEPERIRLIRRDRGRVAPLVPAEAAGRAAEAVDPETGASLSPVPRAELERQLARRLLRVRRVAPGEERSGFLYYPSGQYTGARAVMTEEESGESEGFLIRFEDNRT